MPLPARDTLLDRCLRGERSAQQELYQREVASVFHLVIRLVTNHADAEDLTQECFVRVFANLRKFRGEAALRTWIKRIAINLCLAHLKREQPVLIAPTEVELAVPIPELDASSDLAEVHRAIKQLPRGCRVVLTLHLLEGYRHREIAEILDVSVGTVKSQYWRAKKLLRQILCPKTECDG